MTAGGLGGYLAEAASRPCGRDRHRGSLLGLAAGNALGLPVEGWPRSGVALAFPNGVSGVDPRERHRPWDDDLAQAVLLGEALLVGEGLDLEDLAARLVGWRRGNGRGVGGLTREVIDALEAGTPATEAARLVWERSGRTSAGNGAVMRCAPVALRWRRSPARLVEEARTSALVTHADPRCAWTAVAVAALVARRLSGCAPDVPGLAEALAGAGAPGEVSAALGAAAGASLDDLELDGWAMGYTVKAMQVAAWAAEQEGFAEPLAALVAAGGDTDTNGAVAGAVLGARGGDAAVPGDWLANIAGAGEVAALAGRLWEASEGAG